MEKKHFALEIKENSKVTRIFQIVFGILCIAIALYWVFFHLSSLKSDPTLWITIIFLAGFGAYQVAAGFGKISRFIEIEQEQITLKQNAFLPKIPLKSIDFEKIELYPLSICFLMDKKKKMVLRFGLSNTEIIEPVKEAVTEFAGLNGILLEQKKEEL
jgi:hypothetical protein